MWFQYNIVNCKVVLIWFILSQRLQAKSVTVKREREAVLNCAIYGFVLL